MLEMDSKSSSITSPVTTNTSDSSMYHRPSKSLHSVECHDPSCQKTALNRPQRLLPGKYSRLPDHLKQKLLSKYPLPETATKMCNVCYYRLNRACDRLLKSHKRSLKRIENISPKLTTGNQKIHQDNNILKTHSYACGWCKFHAMFVSTVVRHHYKKHQMKEVDVVRLNISESMTKAGRSAIGFSCDTCAFVSKYRHQMRLHSNKCHKNAFNHEGLTDYESDTGSSPAFPYLFHNVNLPNNYWQLRQKYKLKDVKIQCVDILASDSNELLETEIEKAGITKICVDNLSPDNFVALAIQHKEDASFYNSNVKGYLPVSMTNLKPKEIDNMVRMNSRRVNKL